ncbi:hypothetical protein CH354_04485 [Leptospira levettii]|uniref:hypothetical protein n=1 Tax=Leptospira levettii TaxID=2023178 RepID=UPI000C2ACB50|nr:hypothetical protein [Leptospira levettii]MCW7474143.1 hypothetical protein [Leptospira levettii]PJZ38481.1 hypothetical protein CH354_04485 [Leptospira levettii]PJZ86960.1 hypothetical protein CH368_19295 [Leptospira levettii]PKA01815.1 hypothetical protein CH369_01055 [Leptospira levettii]
MHEDKDKKEFILKFLEHINLGNKNEIIDFNSKTSHIHLAIWIFLFISTVSMIFFPKQFPIQNFLENSKCLKDCLIDYELVKTIMIFISFAFIIRIYTIWIERNELIESLSGFRILLDYMRVDELALIKNLKLIFPNLEEFEIVDFTKAVFVSKLWSK